MKCIAILHRKNVRRIHHVIIQVTYVQMYYDIFAIVMA